MKIAVAGTGYAGLVTAVCLAKIGHTVTCVDVDKEKINMLKKLKCPIYEDGLEELMVQCKNDIFYTTEYAEAYKNCNVIFIGVGTPEKEDGSANLEYVYKVCDEIKSCSRSDKVIVVKSTVPIGTNKKLELYMNNNSKYKFHFVSNPEFLSQGTAVRDTLNASRIVVGTNDNYSRKIMEELYRPLTKSPYNVPYLSMNRESAEMVKYASNDFLALKISYINEIANICEKTGANIDDVALSMGYDDRIGKKFLKAGMGYGGSCFPKDTKALYYLAKNLGYELKTVSSAIEVNLYQKQKLINKAKEDFGSLENKKVAVLGLSFKPGTDDLRESPAIDNVNMLLDYGAVVNVYDPISIDKFKKIYKNKINYYHNIDDTIKDCDFVFIITEWKEIVEYDLNKYKDLMNTAVVYDGRNCYNLDEVLEAGIKYYSIGR